MVGYAPVEVMQMARSGGVGEEEEGFRYKMLYIFLFQA
jgi:hypothetical protein